MPFLRSNNIDLAYEDSGPQDGPAIVMVMGLAAQLTAWPPAMIRAFNDAGFRTIRFDNRDIGLSQKLDHKKPPNLLVQSALARLKLPVFVPYRLPDMVRDTVGLMQELKIPRAHIVGVSMGGMISQILAARHPDKVASLTAIMTSTNRRGLPGPSPTIMKALFRPGPAPATTEEVVERGVKMWNMIRTQDGGLSEDELRVRVQAAVERSYCPAGQKRQTAAIVATGDLRRWTRRIKSPTLVIHGDADPLVNVAAGKDVAANIRNSRLEIIKGMAHDLPPNHIDRVTSLIINHVQAPTGQESLSA